MQLFYWRNATEFLIFTQILPLIGLILLVAFPVVFFYFWKGLIPKPVRQMFWANRRKQPLYISVHDSGRAIIGTVTEKTGNGVVYTSDGHYKLVPKLVPKENPTYPQARLTAQAVTNGADPPTANPDGSGADPPPTPDLTQDATERIMGKYVEDYSDYFHKRINIVGLGVPLLIGYSGKMTLMNPFVLSLYEAGQMIPFEDQLDLIEHKKIVTIKKKSQVKGSFFRRRETISLDDDLQQQEDEQPQQASYDFGTLVRPLMLLDPRNIANIITMSYDETQMSSVITDAERMGLMGKPNNKMTWILLIICVAALAGGVAYFFLMNKK